MLSHDVCTQVDSFAQDCANMTVVLSITDTSDKIGISHKGDATSGQAVVAAVHICEFESTGSTAAWRCM